MHPLVVVTPDEGAHLPLELPGQVVVLQSHHVLQRPVIPLDLALGHRVVGLAPRVPHLVLLQVLRQSLRHEARPVVREQPRAMTNLDVLDPGLHDGPVQKLRDVGRCHSRQKLPVDDKAAEVVQHRQRVVYDPQPTTRKYVKSVCQSSWTRRVGWSKRSLADSTT